MVDAAVQVLIRSGVSTPELRELARHRIQVENAGMYKMPGGGSFGCFQK